MRNFVSHIKKYVRGQTSANFTWQNAVLTRRSTPKPMRLRFPARERTAAKRRGAEAIRSGIIRR
jgi:hypothetical protein